MVRVQRPCARRGAHSRSGYQALRPSGTRITQARNGCQTRRFKWSAGQERTVISEATPAPRGHTCKSSFWRHELHASRRRFELANNLASLLLVREPSCAPHRTLRIPAATIAGTQGSSAPLHRDRHTGTCLGPTSARRAAKQAPCPRRQPPPPARKQHCPNWDRSPSVRSRPPPHTTVLDRGPPERRKRPIGFTTRSGRLECASRWGGTPSSASREIAQPQLSEQHEVSIPMMLGRGQ